MTSQTAAAGGDSEQFTEDDFVCPISQEVMRDPVILVADGHTYERSSLEQWFATWAPVEEKRAGLVPNHTLRGIIESAVARNPAWRLQADAARSATRAPALVATAPVTTPASVDCKRVQGGCEEGGAKGGHALGFNAGAIALAEKHAVKAGEYTSTWVGCIVSAGGVRTAGALS
ncbi:hypothetical protein T484DRAFT_1796313 [Baffinella frigidus]|nr:hypothetical protein T484DRAFT_1796313 [Cryptophyta sp. CCMP2293]